MESGLVKSQDFDGLTYRFLIVFLLAGSLSSLGDLGQAEADEDNRG